MKNKSSDYKNIFKSTFLFGFVQIFNILTKVLLNKAAALFLGAEGIGLIGIFQSISEMLKTFFGLGISQSAVRDISKANTDGNKKDFSEIITITHKMIWITSFVGAVFTAVFSSYLSIISFGDESYSFAFILLSVVIFLNILVDGQLGILKGMRQLRALAKATIFGSATGLVFGVPFYYFLGNDGIVPTLVVVAIASLIFSTYYVKKIEFEKINMTVKEIFSKSSLIIKMGVALMFVTFAGMVSEYIIKIYISNNSDLSTVGIYQAGLTIVSGYFSIVILAMMTDYYPRISGVHDNNEKLKEELNRQVKVGLILITPLIVVFMFVMHIFVELLYSKEFLPSIDYMRYAIFWTLIIIVSNPIDMILIAKQNTRVFLLVTIFYRIIGTILSIYSFYTYSLSGLGVAMMIMAIIHIVLMQSIMYRLYKISIDIKSLKIFLVSIIFVILAFLLSDMSNIYIKYLLGGILIVISILYSLKHFNEVTDLNLINLIMSKLKRNKYESK